MKSATAPRQLLAVPDQFRQTALAFPDKVRQAVALLDDPAVAADGLAKSQALADYGKRIKATTEEVNSVQYGKLLLAAKVGELCPAPSASERGKKGGRGNKAPEVSAGAFSEHTLANYRKLVAYQKRGKIDAYREDVVANDHAQEVSLAGFMRFVGTNLKGAQNKGVVEWYTPKEHVDAAREVMGSIDLDPASNPKANEIVQAGEFYTQEDDGLSKPWAGNVFLNPPFQAKLIAEFVNKLCESVASGDVTQAILLTNNSTDTKWWHQAAGACQAICFTLGRVPFYDPDGETAAPTNGHTFFYFEDALESFRSVFASLRAVWDAPTTKAMKPEK